MSTGSARKLGQSPIPIQQVLGIITGIIHRRPVLDVSLTPLQDLRIHATAVTAVGVWVLPIFGQVPGPTLFLGL